MTGIYFVFKKTLSDICQLDTTLHSFPNKTWLYANSLGADPNVCGYYVGVANSNPTDQMVQFIRSSAKAVKATLLLSMMALAVAISI